MLFGALQLGVALLLCMVTTLHPEKPHGLMHFSALGRRFQ